MQAAQRLVLQVCDAQEREDVKRNMLSELVPLMLELIEAPDFEPERCVQPLGCTHLAAALISAWY